LTKDTIQKLTKINLDFYNRIGPLWNQSNNYYWLGWLQLLPVLKSIQTKKKVLKIADLGAGNCRFLNFLLNNLDIQIDYTAVDFSNQMLSLKDFSENPKIKRIKILELDITRTNLKTFFQPEKFDLITAFGLFHHLPGFKIRAKIFENIYEILKPDGNFIFTTWNFLNVPRLVKRIAWSKDFSDDYVLKIFELKYEEMEKNDFILDWVKKDFGYRYAHFFDDLEIQQLCKNKFAIQNSFYADGKEKNRNRYFILTSLFDIKL
jgi:SAM-dependent methyltransferase